MNSSNVRTYSVPMQHSILSLSHLIFLLAHRTTWLLQDRVDPVVLCMTDELAKWALRQAEEGRPVWKRLADMRTVTELEELVFNERQLKAMRADDTTLVSISFGAISRDELPDA